MRKNLFSQSQFEMTDAIGALTRQIDKAFSFESLFHRPSLSRSEAVEDFPAAWSKRTRIAADRVLRKPKDTKRWKELSKSLAGKVKRFSTAEKVLNSKLALTRAHVLQSSASSPQQRSLVRAVVTDFKERGIVKPLTPALQTALVATRKDQDDTSKAVVDAMVRVAPHVKRTGVDHLYYPPPNTVVTPLAPTIPLPAPPYQHIRDKLILGDTTPKTIGSATFLHKDVGRDLSHREIDDELPFANYVQDDSPPYSPTTVHTSEAQVDDRNFKRNAWSVISRFDTLPPAHDLHFQPGKMPEYDPDEVWVPPPFERAARPVRLGVLDRRMLAIGRDDDVHFDSYGNYRFTGKPNTDWLTHQEAYYAAPANPDAPSQYWYNKRQLAPNYFNAEYGMMTWGEIHARLEHAAKFKPGYDISATVENSYKLPFKKGLKLVGKLNNRFPWEHKLQPFETDLLAEYRKHLVDPDFIQQAVQDGYLDESSLEPRELSRNMREFLTSRTRSALSFDGSKEYPSLMKSKDVPEASSSDTTQPASQPATRTIAQLVEPGKQPYQSFPPKPTPPEPPINKKGEMTLFYKQFYKFKQALDTISDNGGKSTKEQNDFIRGFLIAHAKDTQDMGQLYRSLLYEVEMMRADKHYEPDWKYGKEPLSVQDAKERYKEGKFDDRLVRRIGTAFEKDKLLESMQSGAAVKDFLYQVKKATDAAKSSAAGSIADVAESLESWARKRDRLLTENNDRLQEASNLVRDEIANLHQSMSSWTADQVRSGAGNAETLHNSQQRNSKHAMLHQTILASIEGLGSDTERRTNADRQVSIAIREIKEARMREFEGRLSAHRGIIHSFEEDIKEAKEVGLPKAIIQPMEEALEKAVSVADLFEKEVALIEAENDEDVTNVLEQRRSWMEDHPALKEHLEKYSSYRELTSDFLNMQLKSAEELKEKMLDASKLTAIHSDMVKYQLLHEPKLQSEKADLVSRFRQLHARIDKLPDNEDSLHALYRKTLKLEEDFDAHEVHWKQMVEGALITREAEQKAKRAAELSHKESAFKMTKAKHSFDPTTVPLASSDLESLTHYDELSPRLKKAMRSLYLIHARDRTLSIPELDNEDEEDPLADVWRKKASDLNMAEMNALSTAMKKITKMAYLNKSSSAKKEDYLDFDTSEMQDKRTMERLRRATSLASKSIAADPTAEEEMMKLLVRSIQSNYSQKSSKLEPGEEAFKTKEEAEREAEETKVYEATPLEKEVYEYLTTHADGVRYLMKRKAELFKLVVKGELHSGEWVQAFERLTQDMNRSYESVISNSSPAAQRAMRKELAEFTKESEKVVNDYRVNREYNLKNRMDMKEDDLHAMDLRENGPVSDFDQWVIKGENERALKAAKDAAELAERQAKEKEARAEYYQKQAELQEQERKRVKSFWNFHKKVEPTIGLNMEVEPTKITSEQKKDRAYEEKMLKEAEKKRLAEEKDAAMSTTEESSQRQKDKKARDANRGKNKQGGIVRSEDEDSDASEDEKNADIADKYPTADHLAAHQAQHTANEEEYQMESKPIPRGEDRTIASHSDTTTKLQGYENEQTQPAGTALRPTEGSNPSTTGFYNPSAAPLRPTSSIAPISSVTISPVQTLPEATDDNDSDAGTEAIQQSSDTRQLSSTEKREHLNDARVDAISRVNALRNQTHLVKPPNVLANTARAAMAIRDRLHTYEYNTGSEFAGEMADALDPEITQLRGVAAHYFNALHSASQGEEQENDILKRNLAQMLQDPRDFAEYANGLESRQNEFNVEDMNNILKKANLVRLGVAITHENHAGDLHSKSTLLKDIQDFSDLYKSEVGLDFSNRSHKSLDVFNAPIPYGEGDYALRQLAEGLRRIHYNGSGLADTDPAHVAQDVHDQVKGLEEHYSLLTGRDFKWDKTGLEGTSKQIHHLAESNSLAGTRIPHDVARKYASDLLDTDPTLADSLVKAIIGLDVPNDKKRQAKEALRFDKSINVGLKFVSNAKVRGQKGLDNPLLDTLVEGYLDYRTQHEAPPQSYEDIIAQKTIHSLKGAKRAAEMRKVAGGTRRAPDVSTARKTKAREESDEDE